MRPAPTRLVCGRVFLHPPPAQGRGNLGKRHFAGPISNETPFKPLSLEPVARPGKGAHLTDCLATLETALARHGPGFIAFTILWRRLMPLAEDREIGREQADLVHRLRRALARRGLQDPVIFSVLERSAQQGIHGHVLAQAPRVQDHAEILNVVEAGLVRRFGPLPPRTFHRDGRRRKNQREPPGSIWTWRQAKGALQYRLKSLPREAEEHGVRRGVGLRPVMCISVKVSRGRTHER